MTWTYSGNPSNSSLDAVRFKLGDTDFDDQQLSDEEIAYLLTSNSSNILDTAIEGARAIAAKYRRKVNRAVGDLRIDYSDLAKQYDTLVTRLVAESTVTGGGAPPYAGGISLSDKDTDRENTDLVQPRFRRAMHDNVGGDESDTTSDEC